MTSDTLDWETPSSCGCYVSWIRIAKASPLSSTICWSCSTALRIYGFEGDRVESIIGMFFKPRSGMR